MAWEKNSKTARTSFSRVMGMAKALWRPTAWAMGARGKFSSRVTSGIQRGDAEARTRPGRPTSGVKVRFRVALVKAERSLWGSDQVWRQRRDFLSVRESAGAGS